MAQHQLRTAAQQALEFCEFLWREVVLNDWAEGQREAAEAALRAALAEPCPCGDRSTAQCPGEWEPGCDLGNNPKYAKRVEMTPKELAASIKRGEKWKVAEPVQEPVRLQCTTCGTVYADGVPPQVPVQEPVQEPVAWAVYDIKHGGSKTLHWPEQHSPNGDPEQYKAVPLYSAPPQRKPLPLKEVERLIYEHTKINPNVADDRELLGYIVNAARAIERAHGIDGAPEERHFCPRCGKRTNGIHTCTPPAPLTDEVIAKLWHQNGGFHHHFARAIERWLKGNP